MGLLPPRTVVFELGGMVFEYDEEKNRINIKKHGISFRSAARVFFDYDRIEMYGENNSQDEDRYDTIGDTSAGNLPSNGTIIGNVNQSKGTVNDILLWYILRENELSRMEELQKLLD